jgi:hypothetical protein
MYFFADYIIFKKAITSGNIVFYLHLCQLRIELFGNLGLQTTSPKKTGNLPPEGLRPAQDAWAWGICRANPLRAILQSKIATSHVRQIPQDL